MIPTRERGRYLEHSLNTTLTCASECVEILVSDNASEDNTASLLKAQRYRHVKYVRTKKRVSICANFESAFQNASGKYILCLGDNDAVLPSGIAELLEMLETKSPCIVSWPQIQYLWPSQNADGFLKIKRRHLRGGAEDRSPAETMQAICAGESGGSSFHCGCVSKALVQRITEKAGRFFYYSIPDASWFAAFAFANTYVHLNRPVTLSGTSSVSNRTALHSPASNAYAAFVHENSNAAEKYWLDLRSRSVFAFGLDGLLVTRRIFQLTSPPVDLEKWKERILRDIGSMPGPMRDTQICFVNRWLAKNGINPIDRSLIKWSSPEASNHWRPCRRIAPKISLSSVVIPARPHFIENVESAARTAETLIGDEALNNRALRPIAYLRWFKLMKIARLLQRDNGKAMMQPMQYGRPAMP
ncbi:MAG: glycosyltransferase [Rhodomicrobium sp.]